jgi:glycosyltransferase involved in cell wall biosynthesis
MGSEGGGWGRLLAAMPRVGYELAEHAYGPLVAPRLVAAGRGCSADVLYERHALNNTAGVRAARRLGIPLLLEVNSPLAVEKAAHDGLVLAGWARAVERRVLRAADRVLVVTAVLADMLVSEGVGRERIVVVPNGVDLERYPREEPRDDGEVVVGFTGFFRAWHGLDALVDALADGAMPARTRLLLVGDGPARGDVEARATLRGVADRVTVTGAVPREAIPDHVRSMDICVQPAATSYASPLKLFEYMAAGRAIVAPDQPNLREVLTDGSDAVLFPPGDTGAMTAAIAALARDAPRRRQLGAAARQTLESVGYTWAANAQRVESIASQALSVGPS